MGLLLPCSARCRALCHPPLSGIHLASCGGPTLVATLAMARVSSSRLAGAWAGAGGDDAWGGEEARALEGAHAAPGDAVAVALGDPGRAEEVGRRLAGPSGSEKAASRAGEPAARLKSPAGALTKSGSASMFGCGSSRSSVPGPIWIESGR
jgi:hypothetical protein